MRLEWTEAARHDVDRLVAFLLTVDVRAAGRVVDALYSAAERLCQHPELGPRVSRFPSRDVRRLIANEYEIRYERAKDALIILRVWHVKEDR